MNTPAWLHKLLTYVPLSAGIQRRLGPEDRISLEFANELRFASLEGRLRAIWLHPANELAGRSTGTMVAIARALGLIPGAPDFMFIGAAGGMVIEMKSKDGSQSPSQKLYQKWCEAIGVPYHIARSSDAALSLLMEGGFLEKPKGGF